MNKVIAKKKIDLEK